MPLLVGVDILEGRQILTADRERFTIVQTAGKTKLILQCALISHIRTLLDFTVEVTDYCDAFAAFIEMCATVCRRFEKTGRKEAP